MHEARARSAGSRPNRKPTPKLPEAKAHNRLRRHQCCSETFREQAQGLCQNRAEWPAELKLNLHEKNQGQLK